LSLVMSSVAVIAPRPEPTSEDPLGDIVGETDMPFVGEAGESISALEYQCGKRTRCLDRPDGRREFACSRTCFQHLHNMGASAVVLTPVKNERKMSTVVSSCGSLPIDRGQNPWPRSRSIASSADGHRVAWPSGFTLVSCSAMWSNSG
jgi:hypothetical protein